MTSNTCASGTDRVQGLAQLEHIAAALETLTGEIAALRASLEHAAEAEPAAKNGANGTNGGNGAAVRDFMAETVIVTIGEDGQPAYRVKGPPFVKFGVRVWPEVLPALGLDPQALKPGPNPFSARVRAVLNEDGKPKKVIGLAA